MVSLQRFRQALPDIAEASSIELYLASYSQVLQLFGPKYCDWLSIAELGKNFYRETDRLRFIAARLLLRCCLSQKGPVAPHCWQIDVPQHGKPFLCGPNSPKVALPHFNLAHSGDYVALAFSYDLELGLDIEEQGNKKRNIRGIAKMLFDKTEQKKLHILLQNDKMAAVQLFYQLWCRYEALGKLEGTGLLARPQNSKTFAFTEDQFSGATSQYSWALYWRYNTQRID